MKEMDRQEAERLVNSYSDLILRLSYTYLKSVQDAEDICQTVFLKLLSVGKTFQSREHEKAWVVRTAINACKDELSAYRRRMVPLEDVPEAAAPIRRAGGGDGAARQIPGGDLPLLLRGVFGERDRGSDGPERGGGVRPSQPGKEKTAGAVRRQGI